MSDNPELHQCCTCGYEWKHGVHGGHSCTDTLSARLASQQAAHDAEIAKLKEEVEHKDSFNRKLFKSVEASNERIAHLEGLVALQDAAIKYAIEDLAIRARLSEDDSLNIGQGCLDQMHEAISASAETVQAFRDKLTNPLRREVAMLNCALKQVRDCTCNICSDCGRALNSVSTDERVQATAQAYEQEVEAREAVKALEEARADNGRGFSLWFSREEWGGIIDGLGLEIARSGGRKKTNPESTSDVRMTMCERIIAAINNASERRATSKKAGRGL